MKYFFHIVDITANAYLPLKCLKGIVLCMFSQRLDLFYIKIERILSSFFIGFLWPALLLTPAK